jgi:hypothetical protein
MPAAANRLVSNETSAPATVAVAKPTRDVQITSTLQQMAAIAGTSPLKIMREYCSLGFGPGQVSFADYTRLRLFENGTYPDKRAVVGQRKNSDIDLTINFRHDWIGLFSDKVASASYLAAHGFPTIPILAIYADRVSSPSSQVIRDRDGLRRFLSSTEAYPIFGKPAGGIQSLGSLGIRRFIAASNSLETMSGEEIPLDAYVSDIVENYPAGYLFQKFLSPHPVIRGLCGDRLATVRIVTLTRDDEPAVFRACWKIPSGANLADNYWRSGNMLARLDLASGTVQRVTSGAGLELAEHTVHPDTQTPMIGLSVPNWADAVSTAIEAARLLRLMPLIGFDIAMSESGPVIVEMNHNPDFFLNQLADTRGVLDADFQKVIENQKRKAAERVKEIKRDARKL